jgi:predicted esterase
MNRFVDSVSLGLLSFFFSMFLFAVTSFADVPTYGIPSTINASSKFLFFFHNYYVETKGPDGDCKYFDILKAFTDKGYVVISEVRPKDAPVVEYAKKATSGIQMLLDAGVPPENITVAGHSKGAVIALQVASLLEKPKVNYVIMAGCGIKGLENAYPDSARLKGQFLSVYASSDKVAGSCSALFLQAKLNASSKEITLESPAGHQLFFKPTDVWLEPVSSWLKNES